MQINLFVFPSSFDSPQFIATCHGVLLPCLATREREREIAISFPSIWHGKGSGIWHDTIFCNKCVCMLKTTCSVSDLFIPFLFFWPFDFSTGRVCVRFSCLYLCATCLLLLPRHHYDILTLLLSAPWGRTAEMSGFVKRPRHAIREPFFHQSGPSSNWSL